MVSWRDQLPVVRGRYVAGVRLAEQTWFRVGGAADVLYRPADEDDLVYYLSRRPENIPVCVIGAGSNLLVRDGGISGVVIRLGRGLSDIRIEGDLIHVGAGCLDRTVSLTCRDAGIGGLAFLVGIPGTIGGAVRMNAGAYGSEIKDVLVYATVLDLEGRAYRLTPEDLQMSYRHTTLPEGWVVTGAVLKGIGGQDPAELGQEIDAILREREASQPTRGRTGGSTFKNPAHQKAWQLIDAAGCRGLKIGDAQVSEKHCNFLLNIDQATANDLESLGEEVRRRVYETSGVSLDWEIVKMGYGRSQN
ncbi:MAG: UDP-N-acetylenolpyruvoylglucosamine reductase [Alphaproteobacteria bacterium]|jgi:UDP-N-acetylmuramate dehydrogenase|nr:UDP-N-acetylenolpyruvoylglucosamine reductase [Alphaproteobacteria bacterium]